MYALNTGGIELHVVVRRKGAVGVEQVRAEIREPFVTELDEHRNGDAHEIRTSTRSSSVRVDLTILRLSCQCERERGNVDMRVDLNG